MNIHDTLTKENFWNEIEVRFPKSTKLFLKWIDVYKQKTEWNKLFNSDSEYQNAEGKNAAAPKFHEISYEMQQGIWISFAHETLNNIFEQPEYNYCFDLAEDIKQVFSEIEVCISTN